MARTLNPAHWDDCVYRVPRDQWDAMVTRQVRPTTPFERLTGLEVRVLDDIDTDDVFVIDVRRMRDALDEALWPQPEPIDPIAWKAMYSIDFLL